MSTSRTNSLNSHDRSLNGLGDGGIYHFSRGSVRKEYSLPALNNEAHNHAAYSPPPFKLPCTTSNDLPTHTDSFDMVFFSTNDDQNLGSSATCDINVFSEGIKHELEPQQSHKGSQQDVGLPIETSRQFYSVDNTPIASKRKRLSLGKLKITGNVNQKSCSINNGYSALNDDTLSHVLEPDTLLNSLEPDTLLNGLDLEFELHSYPEDTSSFSKNTHETGIAPCTDGAMVGILNDRVKFTKNIGSDDLQTCRSSCASMATASEMIKSSTLPVSSSSRNKRQRQIEIDQVHQVYKQIAPHCDQVRQKAWPRVKRFLKDVEPGSMVVDVDSDRTETIDNIGHVG